MGLNENDLIKLVKICSNNNYGYVTYTTIYDKNNDIYDFYIKDCSASTIADIVVEGYRMEMTGKGLHIFNFY